MQKKFKHSSVLGITGNYNKENAQRFANALIAHVQNANVQQIVGDYRHDSVIHYYDPVTQVNVMTDRNGAFRSAWTLTSQQQQNLISRGSL